MSALPPKADMCGAPADVRYGPIADMAVSSAQARSDGGKVSPSARFSRKADIFKRITESNSEAL